MNARISRLTVGTALISASLLVPSFSTAQQISARNGSTVTLGARVQAQFEANNQEQVPSSFFVRRAWVTISGSLNDFVSGRVQFDAQGATALEAYLQLSASPAFRLQLGQFKRGISNFWLVANSDLPVIERDGRVTGVDECPGVGGVCSFGQFTGSLGLDAYEPGILATGRGGNWGYRFTLTNGEGTNRKDVNSGKSTSGRLSYHFGESGRLSLYGTLDETQTATATGTLWMPAYGLEVELGGWRDGPHLMASGVSGRNWKESDDANFKAFQLMGFWYVPLEDGRFAGVEPLLRLSWASTEQYDGPELSGLVITPGFMLYAIGKNGISTNLDIYRSLEDKTEWSLKVQAFTFF